MCLKHSAIYHPDLLIICLYYVTTIKLEFAAVKVSKQLVFIISRQIDRVRRHHESHEMALYHRIDSRNSFLFTSFFLIRSPPSIHRVMAMNVQQEDNGENGGWTAPGAGEGLAAAITQMRLNFPGKVIPLKDLPLAIGGLSTGHSIRSAVFLRSCSELMGDGKKVKW